MRANVPMETALPLRPRRWRQRIVIGVLFLLLIPGVRLQRQIEGYAGAEPITITFDGLQPQEMRAIRLAAVSKQGYELGLNQDDNASRWRIGFFYWSRCLRFFLPRSAIQRPVPVHIQIGQAYSFDTDTVAIARDWPPYREEVDAARREHSEDGNPLTDAPAASPRLAGRGFWKDMVAFDSPPSVSGPRAPIPFFRYVINWTQDDPFLTFILPILVPLLILIPAYLLVSAVLKPRSKAVTFFRWCLSDGRASAREPIRSAPRDDRLWFAVGATALAGGILALTHGTRYAFVQDDNMSQFFPTILQGCRSLEHGMFSTLNPYQLLGSPTSSVGVYALTYPVTYLSYAIAAHLLRDAYLTLDVFVLLHMAAGYALTYIAARRAGIRPCLATAASLSFVLCGFMVVYVRCWFYMAPVLLWTPLLVLSVLSLADQGRPINWRWIVGTGLAIGLYFHAGNAQMWTYALLLCGIAVLLLAWAGRIPRGRLLWTVPALLIGLSIAAPLLIVQAEEVAKTSRDADYANGLLRGITAMLLPSPFVDAWHPGMTAGLPKMWAHLYHFAPVYYCGPLFLGLGLLVLLSLPFLRWGRRVVAANVWLLCGGVALWFGLAEDGGISQLVAFLPPFNKFQHNWKFLPFIALFFAVGSGVILERLLRRAQEVGKPARRWADAMAVTVIVLLVYNTAISKPVLSFVDPPYPPLSPGMKALLFNPRERQQRVLTVAPWYRLEHGFFSTMAQNWSTVYRVPVLEGYDPLVSASPLNRHVARRIYPAPILAKPTEQGSLSRPLPQLALRAYGVRWVMLANGYPGQGKTVLLEDIGSHLTLRLREPAVRVFEISGGADPLVFAQANSRAPLPFIYTAQGAVADVSSVGGKGGGRVVVNLLARSKMRAWADGQPLTIVPDEWDRITVDVPAGARTLTVRYLPAWGKGLAVGAILLFAAIAMMAGLGRRKQPAPGVMAETQRGT